MKRLIISAAIASILTGCAATGDEFQGDVFDSAEVNSSVPSRLVTIVTVSKARVKVDNTQQKAAATFGGAALGAVGGAVLGRHHGASGAGIGAIAGGVAGGAAGSMVKDKVLVPGVLISYSLNNQIYSNAQVGELCNFTAGKTLLVEMIDGSKRIQPNAECPAPAK